MPLQRQGRRGHVCLTGPIPTDDQPVWLCHLAQLPLLCGGGLTSHARVALGVWRAIAGGVRERDARSISLPLPLAGSQGHRHLHGGVLPDTLCVATAIVDPVDAPGILSGVSSPASQASGTSSLPSATNGALRVGAHGVMRGPTRYTRLHSARA